MKVIRSTIADLVERRLWPVAVLLAVALVAVPVVIARTGNSTEATVSPEPALPTTTDPASGTTRAAVAVESTTSTPKLFRGGKVRDPFKSTGSSAKVTTPTTTTTTPETGSGTDTGSSTTGGSTGGSGGNSGSSTGDGTTETPSAPASPEAPKLTVRIGQAGGDLTLIADVPRLKPLPSIENPFFVFLGVLEDRKTAVFMVSSDVTSVIGDGSCQPSADSCQTVELKKDQTEFFTITVEGQPVQYQLDVVKVDVGKLASASAARASIANHSPSGAELLRDGHLRGDESYAGADGYRWLPDSGLLVRVPTAAEPASSSAKGTPAAGSSGEAANAGTATTRQRQATLPGEPVWHTDPAGPSSSGT